VFAARGLSVHRVIWDRRLERAEWTLGDPAQNHRRVLDVALELGFSGDAHFSRRFRRKFGLSPSSYRRRAATPRH
jgi:AraC-like DNA-binding protein